MVPIHFTYGWVLGKQEVRKKWKSAWCKMTFWQIGKVERAAAKNFPSLLDSYFKKSERKSWKNRRINVIFFKVISLLSKEKCQKNERKMPIQIRFSTVWKRERVPIPKFLQIESIYLLYKSFRLRSDKEAAENEKILELHKY